MDKVSKVVLIIYSVWAAIVFALTFMAGGFSRDNMTHMLILCFFFLQLLALPLMKRLLAKLPPMPVFIAWGVASAAVVEGCYMLSKPVFDPLRFEPGMSAGHMLLHLLIDWAFTTPAYVVFFLFFWFMINRYRYRLWEYVLLFGLGQALGDGGFYFLANPLMLIFLPYVLINYHAMNLAPYLLEKDNIKPQKSSWLKYALPIAGTVVLYLVCGGAIMLVGGLLGLR